MKEHRIHERVDYNFEIECRSYFNASGDQVFLEKPIYFKVLNLSVGGLLATSQMKIDEDVLIHYTFYLEDFPYIVMSRMRWVEEIVDGYVYGLEFVTISNMLHRHLHDYINRDAIK